MIVYGGPEGLPLARQLLETIDRGLLHGGTKPMEPSEDGPAVRDGANRIVPSVFGAVAAHVRWDATVGMLRLASRPLFSPRCVIGRTR